MDFIFISVTVFHISNTKCIGGYSGKVFYFHPIKKQVQN